MLLPIAVVPPHKQLYASSITNVSRLMIQTEVQSMTLIEHTCIHYSDNFIQYSNKNGYFYIEGMDYESLGYTSMSE